MLRSLTMENLTNSGRASQVLGHLRAFLTFITHLELNGDKLLLYFITETKKSVRVVKNALRGHGAWIYYEEA